VIKIVHYDEGRLSETTKAIHLYRQGSWWAVDVVKKWDGVSVDATKYRGLTRREAQDVVDAELVGCRL
jgi:hypothetical protein